MQVRVVSAPVVLLLETPSSPYAEIDTNPPSRTPRAHRIAQHCGRAFPTHLRLVPPLGLHDCRIHSSCGRDGSALGHHTHSTPLHNPQVASYCSFPATSPNRCPYRSCAAGSGEHYPHFLVRLFGFPMFRPCVPKMRISNPVALLPHPGSSADFRISRSLISSPTALHHRRIFKRCLRHVATARA